MEPWTHNRVKLKTGHTYHYVDQKPDPARANGDTMICLHGFPDQWFGWRRQIEPWARAGYRVLVPSMLGYGGSDKPHDYKPYSAKPLCADIAALLDSVSVERAVVIAHDWGAAIAWRFALWYPKRIKALIVLSVPYFPPNKHYISPDEAARKVPSFGYQAYFNEPHSSKEVDEHLDLFLRIMFRAPLKATPIFKVGQLHKVLLGETPLYPTPLVIDDKEFEEYKQEFAEGGMHGPLCYYRNTLTRYEQEKDSQVPAEFPQAFPVLLMFGTKDPTCPSSYVKRMPMLVKNLSIVPLLDKGHWVLVEAKDEVTNEVLRWLTSSPTGGKARL